jgi:quercetin dioxygenase-like cupin family protein
MKRPLVLAALLLVGITSIASSQAPQTSAPYVPDPANFTGKVTASSSDDVRAIRLAFEAGARTNWHSHAGGQVILVEKGTLVVQERSGSGNGPGREFKARQAYTVDANVAHWHGARPGEPLTQVAFSFGATKWLEKVTDQQYSAVSKK